MSDQAQFPIVLASQDGAEAPTFTLPPEVAAALPDSGTMSVKFSKDQSGEVQIESIESVQAPESDEAGPSSDDVVDGLLDKATAAPQS